jgi:hypothetical protein
LPDIGAQIDRMKRATIDHEQAAELAWNAAKLRWEVMPTQEEIALSDEPLRGSYANGKTVRDLLKAYRREDAQPTAWATFNRVQEGLIRGGASAVSFTDKRPNGTYRKARPVGSVAESVRINRALWDAAGEILEEAA